ncbi:facilitated trehalose transporter Tret1-like isoform X2 [Rhodnius prolixus]|uniref:facilitated trehalose transporter Tret1-like isoform X2 n=2 Tax=Rhodnius prolixus TaxID=13249 RepID=UPI003D18A842
MIFAEIGWFECYMVQDIWLIFFSRLTAGFALGLTVPVNSLLGEACEPRLRGLLDTISSLIMAVGYNIASYMMQLQSFRNIALVCSIFPIITVIYSYFMPESPLWLCTQQRYDEALKALVWLRGWKYNEQIKKEYEQLCNYCAQNMREQTIDLTEINDDIEINQNRRLNFLKIERKNFEKFSKNLWDNLKYMSKAEMLKPTLIISIVQFFACATPNGILITYLPLLVLQVNPEAPAATIMIIYTTASLIIHTVGAILVPFVGKKVLILISMAGSASGCILVAVYDICIDLVANNYWLFTAVIVILQCFISIGPANLSYTLIGELFPIRGRVLGTVISSTVATVYIMILTLISLPLLNSVRLYIVMTIYCGLYILGFIYFKIFFKETEGKTLELIQKEMSSE